MIQYRYIGRSAATASRSLGEQFWDVSGHRDPLHLAHVCAAQRRALVTLRDAIRATTFATNLLPHQPAQTKALAAVQIAGKAGAVGNARKASRPQSAAAEFADDGRRPPVAGRPGPSRAPATGPGSALYQRQMSELRRCGSHRSGAAVYASALRRCLPIIGSPENGFCPPR
jgi:hypothetical protein